MCYNSFRLTHFARAEKKTLLKNIFLESILDEVIYIYKGGVLVRMLVFNTNNVGSAPPPDLCLIMLKNYLGLFFNVLGTLMKTMPLRVLKFIFGA